MPQTPPELPTPEPLWKYLARAFVRSHRRRPVSFYLLLAMLAVVILGVQIIIARDDPRKLAFLLSLIFIFCFVVMYRAIADAFDILRNHRREKRELYQQTLGDQDFTRELGERVEKKRKETGGDVDWPD